MCDIFSAMGWNIEPVVIKCLGLIIIYYAELIKWIN